MPPADQFHSFVVRTRLDFGDPSIVAHRATDGEQDDRLVEHSMFTCSFPSPSPLTQEEEGFLERVLQAYDSNHYERVAERRGTTYDEAFTYERRRHHLMLLEYRVLDLGPSPPSSDSAFSTPVRSSASGSATDASPMEDTGGSEAKRTPISSRLGSRKRVETPVNSTPLYTPRQKKKHQPIDSTNEAQAATFQPPDLYNLTDVKGLNVERQDWMTMKAVQMPAFNQLVKMNDFMRHKVELWGRLPVRFNLPLQQLARMTPTV